MKSLRWLGLVVGIGLFAWIVRSSDFSAVWRQMESLRWRFGFILLFYVVIFGLDTLGWRFALSRRTQSRIRWDWLFRARLAGEAVNYVTPTAWIGGEPVKAYLLSKRYGVPMAEGMASVVIAKTTFSLSMFLFIVMGIGITLWTQPIEAAVLRWVWMVLFGFGILLLLFLLIQFLKPFQRGRAMVKRILPSRVWSITEKVHEWDESLVRFYRNSPGSVFLSLAFHFLGWVAGVFEIFLILWLLHIPVSLAKAWSIEALWILLKTGAFLIPASLGASEGLLILICNGLRISSVSGLALALIRRARELTWMGLGLVEFSRG